MEILLTGYSGFFGQVIKNTLSGHQIISLARDHADINSDLTKQMPRLPAVDLVIHAAGKAHFVPKTATEKQEFFDVNVGGTKNLLNALSKSAIPQQFVFISSVSVYGLNEGNGISEDQALASMDPYGSSKIQAEDLISEWCAKNNVLCTILRLPLLVGASPPGNLGTMIKAIQRGYYFNIAGGLAKKSMVLAEDVANIIPAAAETGGIFHLTDGYHPSFSELSFLIADQSGKNKPRNIPELLAKIMAKSGDLIGRRAPINSDKLRKITADLTFDDSKARRELGWNPRSVLEAFRIS